MPEAANLLSLASIANLRLLGHRAWEIPLSMTVVKEAVLDGPSLGIELDEAKIAQDVSGGPTEHHCFPTHPEAVGKHKPSIGRRKPC